MIMKIRYDLICDVICGLVVDYCPKPLLFLPFLYLIHYDVLVLSHLFSFPFIIYLFTGLFKLSRMFSFHVRQVISGATGNGNERA